MARLAELAASPCCGEPRARPQWDFLLDQIPHLDPTEAEPIRDFRFDECLPGDLDD